MVRVSLAPFKNSQAAGSRIVDAHVKVKELEQTPVAGWGE
jgi:hypothetical protein